MQSAAQHSLPNEWWPQGTAGLEVFPSLDGYPPMPSEDAWAAAKRRASSNVKVGAVIRMAASLETRHDVLEMLRALHDVTQQHGHAQPKAPPCWAAALVAALRVSVWLQEGDASPCVMSVLDYICTETSAARTPQSCPLADVLPVPPVIEVPQDALEALIRCLEDLASEADPPIALLAMQALSCVLDCCKRLV